MWYERLLKAHGKVHQIFNKFSDDKGGYCAMGAISLLGPEMKSGQLAQEDLPVPFIDCPDCEGHLLVNMYGSSVLADDPITLSSYVVHLNDAHQFSFKKIAGIIKPLEEEYREGGKSCQSSTPTMSESMLIGSATS
jgi:hypothetical protein